MPSNSLEQQAMERVKRMYSSFDRPPSKPEPERPARQGQRDRREEHDRRHEEHAHGHHDRPREHHEPSLIEPPKQEKHGLLELLMKDKDQSLIMLLLVILMKDGADMNLLLALLYILL